MGERITEEMKLWLFDLTHGNLSDEKVLSGFIKHYILHGLTIDHVIDNIAFRTNYGFEGARTAKDTLYRVLKKYILSK